MVNWSIKSTQFLPYVVFFFLALLPHDGWKSGEDEVLHVRCMFSVVHSVARQTHTLSTLFRIHELKNTYYWLLFLGGGELFVLVRFIIYLISNGAVYSDYLLLLGVQLTIIIFYYYLDIIFYLFS